MDESSFEFPSKKSDLERVYVWQLWILKISGQRTETKLLYSRIVPTDYPSKGWRLEATDNLGSFQSEDAGNIKVELLQASHVGIGQDIRNAIKVLYDGNLLSDCEELNKPNPIPNEILNLGLELGEKHNLNYIIRPEVLLPKEHLLIPWTSKSMPGPADDLSNFVSQIVCLKKLNVFQTVSRFNRDTILQIISKIQERLEFTTNFNIKKSSAPRIGNIEWYRFPLAAENLDPLVSFYCKKKNDGENCQDVEVQLMPIGQTKEIILRCRVYDGEEVTHDICRSIAWGSKLRKITIETLQPISEIHVTIWEKRSDGEHELVFENSAILMRTMQMNLSMIGSVFNTTRINLLNKIEKRDQKRAKELTHFERSSRGSDAKIGDYKNDPWVPVNREIVQFMNLVFPEKSKAQFFLNGWDDTTQASGQLSFFEWISDIISRGDKGALILLDPFFDQDGIEIFSYAKTGDTKFKVVTCTQHREKDENPSPTANNLTSVAAKLQQICILSATLLSGLDFELLDLVSLGGGKDQIFHDRYVLLTDSNGMVNEGYHLSNSLQGATRKAPLLVTPIPADILPNVLEYVDDLLDPKKPSSKKIQSITVYSTKKSHESETYIQEKDIPNLNLLFGLLIDDETISTLTPDEVIEVLKSNGLYDTKDGFMLYKLTDLHLRRLISKTLAEQKVTLTWVALTELMAYGHSRKDHIEDEYDSWEAFKELAGKEEELAQYLIEYITTYKSSKTSLAYRERIFTVFRGNSFEEMLENAERTFSSMPEWSSLPYSITKSIEILVDEFSVLATQLLSKLLDDLIAAKWNEANPETIGKMQLVSSIALKLFDFGNRKDFRAVRQQLAHEKESIRAATIGALLTVPKMCYKVKPTLEEILDEIKANVSDDEFRLTLATQINFRDGVHADEQEQRDNKMERLIVGWQNNTLLPRIIKILCGPLVANNSLKITNEFLANLVQNGSISQSDLFRTWADFFSEKVAYRTDYKNEGSKGHSKTFVVNTDIELTQTLLQEFPKLSCDDQTGYINAWIANLEKMWLIVIQPFAKDSNFNLFHETCTRVYWTAKLLELLVRNKEICTDAEKIASDFLMTRHYEIGKANEYQTGRYVQHITNLNSL